MREAITSFVWTPPGLATMSDPGETDWLQSRVRPRLQTGSGLHAPIEFVGEGPISLERSTIGGPCL